MQIIARETTRRREVGNLSRSSDFPNVNKQQTNDADGTWLQNYYYVYKKSIRPIIIIQNDFYMYKKSIRPV